MNKRGLPILALLTLLTFFAGARDAAAGNWMAYLDANGCDSEYQGRRSGHDGPFDSEEACQSFVDSVRSTQPVCFQYECRDEGGGDDSATADSSADSSGFSMPSVPLPSGGMSQQALGMGLGILGAVMIGAAVSSLLTESPRPEAPEAVRRFQVRAVNAVRDKRYADAISAYEDGLQVAPWWPQGHFNMALLLGQVHYYDEAVEQMQDYLALVPEAPNARAAQDQIYR